MEAGQRGQKELIRATVALGGSCGQHPVPWNRPSPPSPRVSVPAAQAQEHSGSRGQAIRSACVGRCASRQRWNQAGSGAQ